MDLFKDCYNGLLSNLYTILAFCYDYYVIILKFEIFYHLGGKDMPFNDSKISMPVSQAQQETLKTELGKTMPLLGKSENFLMVGFQDNYDLYMGGKKLTKGAYISVSLFGEASSEIYSQMTGEICNLFERELQIPKENIYLSLIHI